VCGQAAATLALAMSKTTDSNALYWLAQGLSAVAARLEPKEAAATLALAMSRTTDSYTPFPLGQTLSAVLTGVPLSGQRRHATLAATAVGLAADSRVALSALPFLAPTVLSPPCRLSDQELVELLKQPLFVGEARRVILDLLGDRHGRRFADQWEFVQFAEERRLGLDFTTPPMRPDPAPPLTRPKP